MVNVAALEGLARLRDTGVLSEEEFAAEKAKILKEGSRPSPAQQLLYDQPPVSHNTRAHLEYDAAKKSVFVNYLLWFFLGLLSVHRFYTHKWLSGFLQIAVGVIGILAIIPSIFVDLSGARSPAFDAISFAGWLPFFWIIWLFFDAILIPSWVKRYNLRLAQGF